MNENPALQPARRWGRRCCQPPATSSPPRGLPSTAGADPEDSEAEAVHDFRRAMKRWRALLRLIEPFLGTRPGALRDEARDLARALAGARDAQGALDALADLAKSTPALSARSFATMRSRIEQVRQAAETSLDPDMRKRLGEALAAADDAVDRWPLDTLTHSTMWPTADALLPRGPPALPEHWAAAAARNCTTCASSW